MKIEPGNYVIANLHSPREKIFGIADEISAAGVFIRGIDLSYFDDWCAAIAAGEPYLPMTDQFVPMWRVEKVTRDEASNSSPSLSELCEQRTGKPPAMH
jgi:hypothetical protein